MTIAFFILWGLLYFGFILYLQSGWNLTIAAWDTAFESAFEGDIESRRPTVAIIIPARNEAHHLPTLLNALAAQDYPLNLLEVIVVDDESTDHTQQVAQSFDQNPALRIKVLPSDPSLRGAVASPKKRAIMTALAHTDAAFILTTDADCAPGPAWVTLMVQTLLQQNAVAVSGPVVIHPANGQPTLWHRLQRMEFSSLIVTGAATLGRGWATMCNGANLGYLRSAFEAVGGFSGATHLPGGDDELLWHKLAAQYPGQLAFVPMAGAVVRTEPVKTWADFSRQRIRWASKWSHYDNKRYSLLAAAVGLWYIGMIGLVALTLLGYASVSMLLIFLSNKLLADLLLLLPAWGVLRLRLDFLAFLIVGLGYPFYATYFALRTLVNPAFDWKGRTYRPQ